MRLLVYADLQAHDGDERCYNQPTVSLQIHRVRKFYADLKRIYDQHECHGLLDLGDTTDDRSAIPVPVINAVMEGLEPYAGGEFNFKLIGNHEQFLRDTSVDSGRMYAHVFRVINQKAVWEYKDVVYVFASYPDDHTKLATWLDSMGRKYKDKATVLLGHFQAVGAMLNSGETLLGVPKDVLNRFSVSFLGHIHLPQSIGTRIHYVGSPFQQNWGEAYQDKRVGILDTDTLLFQWIPLTGYPRYVQGDLERFTADFDPASEDRWKVILNSYAETEAFFALPHSVRAEAVYNYKVQSESASQETQEAHDWSFEASLRHYLKTIPPPNIGLETEELLAIGQQLATG